MFTGLIREMANVISFNNNILTLNAQYTPKIGDSIAINGACLTVIDISNSTFSVELSPESQNILAIENYANLVHMEPAMMMGDRFEGHIVQGHVDCLGTITNIIDNGNSTDFFISLPKDFLKFVIQKGSITVDGISLTVNDIDNTQSIFRLTIIPHTIENTLFKTYTINSKVNIETDMFARYVYNLFKKDNSNDQLSWDLVDKIMSNY
ncbi:MAG: riboflavin synthase [Campylobacterota bacterium]|nr:riboflavin synthase [Campylobacterota bacterium]